MNQHQWTAVDHYIAGELGASDPALDLAIQATADAGMPLINVSPNQGQLLHVLALTVGARSILEIGTLGGYSTIWLARALAPGGRLISLEFSPKHAAVARANLERAGLSDRTEIRVGPALETLPQLAAEGLHPFDLVFIDADKANTPAYFEWALKLTRPGSMIVTDNVVRNGDVVNEHSNDADIKGVRRFIAAMAAEPRVAATVVQTVGSKGYDGLAIAVVRDSSDIVR